MANSRNEYAVKRIIDCKGHVQKRRYVGQLYGCEPKDSMLESARNIPQHSIIMFNKWVNKKKTGAQIIAELKQSRAGGKIL